MVVTSLVISAAFAHLLRQVAEAFAVLCLGNGAALYEKVQRVLLSEKKLMRVARASLLAIAVIAVFLAWNPDSSVFRIVSFAWAGFGAAFGPLVLFSLFWRRTNRYGALAGMITGGAMIFIWKFVVRPMGGILDIYELLPAFLISALMIVIVSLITPAPEKEITDVFDKVAGR